MDNASTGPPVVDIAAKLATFDDAWAPRIVGAVNDMHVKAVKLRGEFVWHHHADEDEMFLVVKGILRMRLRTGDVDIGTGQFIIIPKGVEHCPVADAEVHVLLFEPKSTVNTGNILEGRTRTMLETI